MAAGRNVAGLLAALLLACGPARAGDVPVATSLADRAQELADAGQPLSAWQALVEGLSSTLPGLAVAGPRAAAEAEIAVLQLCDLTEALSAWPEAASAVPALRAAAGQEAPPRVSFLLAWLHGVALRNVGRCDEARGVFGGLGYVNDVLVLGPFDNERGGGLHVPQPTETSIDLASAMRGKERDVRWRENPCLQHPLRRLLLHEALRPNKQALAYVATAVLADAPRTVVLRLGSSGAFKLFLNGAEVAARNVQRPHAADQDRFALPLAAGWNQLLVKSGVEDQDWTLELRFTDLQGRPLDLPASGARVATPSPELRAATAAALADPARSQPAPEARETLEAADDLQASRLLALYHLIVHPDDLSERTARVYAERAVAAAPGDASALYLLARAQEPEGDDRTEMQVNPRLAALKEVLQRAPDHAGALMDLAAFSLEDNPLPARADDLTRHALAVAPGSWRAASLRAQFLRDRRRMGEADLLLAAAAAGAEARLQPDSAAQRGQDALRRGDQATALAELRAAFDRRVMDGPVVTALVDALVDAGRYDEALGVTQRVLEGSPFATGRMLATAERLEGAGELLPARQLVDGALLVCPDSAPALRLRARLFEREGDVTSAQDDLRQVLALEPGDDKARRHLQILQTGAPAERFEEPYRSDALALLGQPLPEGASEPAECLQRTTVWRVHSDGSEHTYEHLVLRVLSEGGVKQLSGFPIPTLGGAVQVYNVRVIHPDGGIERAPPARGGWRYYDLPPLAVGDLIDVEYRVDDDAPDVFGRYFGIRHEFQPDVLDGLLPVRQAELVVLAPPELPVYFKERRAEKLERAESTDARGLRELRWVARDIGRPSMESSMPGRAELAPVVDVTTFADWDAFARWWWAFIEKEFVTTPAMKDKVAELTAGLSTEAEKVEAIARFVGQEIRYNSWPFGTHGYEPFSAATIFERRFGDCKDKSILMKQMLKEIGVDAVPVLINAEYARAEEPLDAAMVGLFNHCIAYVTPTAERPGYYLDGTADRNPIDYIRADDQGARVLHVTQQGGEIHQIPYAPPAENTLRRRWDVALDADGGGTVTLTDDSNGYFGVRLRYRYGGEQGDLKHELADDLSRDFGAVAVQEASTSDLNDIRQPARLATRFEARGLWTAEGASRALRLGFDDLGLESMATEPAEDRTFDVVLDRPFAHDTSVLWRLPEGARVLELPPDVDLSAPGLLSYRQRARAVPEGIEVQRHFELLVRRIPVADYAGFREAVQQVRQAEERSLRIAPPPTGEGR